MLSPRRARPPPEALSANPCPSCFIANVNVTWPVLAARASAKVLLPSYSGAGTIISRDHRPYPTVNYPPVRTLEIQDQGVRGFASF